MISPVLPWRRRRNHLIVSKKVAQQQTCLAEAIRYNTRLAFNRSKQHMAKMGNKRTRRPKVEKFQTFSRPKVKITRTSASGTTFIDYKDTESLKKMLSGNGKILSRKRTGANAMEQRMLARAVKRSRYMALVPYISSSL
jgi:small subunit ribosomal protein S18